MENKGADDEKGAPTNTGGGFQYQIHPKFIEGQLLNKMKYSWAF